MERIQNILTQYPAAIRLGANGLTFALGSTMLRSPIGFSGGFLCGVVRSIYQKSIQDWMERYPDPGNRVSVALCAEFYGSLGVIAITAYGFDAMTNDSPSGPLLGHGQLSIAYAVALAVASTIVIDTYIHGKYITR